MSDVSIACAYKLQHAYAWAQKHHVSETGSGRTMEKTLNFQSFWFLHIAQNRKLGIHDSRALSTWWWCGHAHIFVHHANFVLRILTAPGVCLLDRFRELRRGGLGVHFAKFIGNAYAHWH